MKSLKKQYHRTTYRWRNDPVSWNYSTRWGYGRALDTFQHCKQYVHDVHDIRYEGWEFSVRAKRNASFMNAYNLEPPVSRCGGKSWKDYSKRRKQWEKVKVIEDDWHDRWAMRLYSWTVEVAQVVALTDL